MPAMSKRLAINGFGRIGRCLLRAIQESPLRDRLEVVAINEPADLDSIAYLTRYDSNHGRFPGTVAVAADGLLIDGRPVVVSHATTPEAVDWAALDLDLVVDCSGCYGTRGEFDRFLAAGSPRLMVSHPAQSAADVDATVVYGINEAALTGAERIVSCGSCTTNAVVPVLAMLEREFGIEQVSLTTLHSVMNDQPLIDGYHHSDRRRTRSAMQSMVPVATGLARGVERLLPALRGRVEAKAIRVPVTNVSAIDVAANLTRPVSAAEVNERLCQAAAGDWSGLIACTSEPHASIDFNHDPHSAIVDAGLTKVSGERLLDLLVWFDNEWGFANRMLDVADHWLSAADRCASEK
jgi:glyceraldehyde 3-phosphate dehydrogenase/D-erythrose 4-phosphate dehydrogenase